MNLSLVEKIVSAVLYEGYMLYPYRPSALKNRQRWNFGALSPQAYSLAQGSSETWSMQTEVLVYGSLGAALDVKIRFLHLLAREVGQLTTPLLELAEGVAPDFQVVPSLEVGGRLLQTWQEAVEREVSLHGHLRELIAQPKRLAFAFPSSQEREYLRGPDGQITGLLMRQQQAIEGAVELSAEQIEPQLFKVTVLILNLTPMEDAILKSRDEALMQSLVSTHTILGVQDGEFVSLLETPEGYREAAASCRNIGAWPVLVGEAGARDCMLSSPIILYDYPQIAPESAGDLFDGTEIDEILTLRIMTLTDEEKREMRGVDEHARRILERTETLPTEQLMKLHGAMRNLHPPQGEKP